MKTKISLLYLLSILSTAAQSNEIVSTSTVESDWLEHQVRWTQGPPSYVARWKAYVENNVVIVCGAGAFTSASNQRETMQVLRDRGFFIDETLFLTDVSFFNKVNRANRLIGSQANCVSTGRRPPRTVKNGVSLRTTRQGRVY